MPGQTHLDASTPRSGGNIDEKVAVDTSRGTEPIDKLFQRQQLVLILVGLIGSGKSTFAEALQQHVPEIQRCNQDDLGDRRRVESLARQSLAQGLSVCIDRTNFDPSQRATWMQIAREYPTAQVWVIVFDTPYEVCAARLQTRMGHPTIKNPDDAMSILARLRWQYHPPSPCEGYTKLLSLGTADQCAMYTREDILSILRRVQDSPSIDRDAAPRLGPSGSRGFRGRLQHTIRGSPYGGHGSHRGGDSGGRGSRSHPYGPLTGERRLNDYWRQNNRGGSCNGGDDSRSWRSPK